MSDIVTGQWLPISQFPADYKALRARGMQFLLAIDTRIIGVFSGVKYPTETDDWTSWWVDDAFYDGDEDPTQFLVLPPVYV